MTTTTTFGFPEAAARLGVTVRTLRRAIRAGRVPAPAQAGAVAVLSAAWLESVQAAVKANPAALTRAMPQSVPPFARYEGTSCWRKYPNRVRDYYAFQAALAV